MRVVIAVLIALIVLLQYRLWFADGGLVEVHRLEQRVAAQKRENEQLRERNRALAAEVKDLKQGLDAVEARARSELGMVGKGETFFQVVEPKDKTADGAAD